MSAQEPPPDPESGPRLSEKGRRARSEQKDRLAAALRENLKKRKAQMRGRAFVPEDGGGGLKDGEDA